MRNQSGLVEPSLFDGAIFLGKNGVDWAPPSVHRRKPLFDGAIFLGYDSDEVVITAYPSRKPLFDGAIFLGLGYRNGDGLWLGVTNPYSTGPSFWASSPSSVHFAMRRSQTPIRRGHLSG